MIYCIVDDSCASKFNLHVRELAFANFVSHEHAIQYTATIKYPTCDLVTMRDVT